MNNRVDDIFFTNSTTGWIVSNNGYLHRTTDGGISWQQQFHANVWLRCLGFFDSQNGFAGIYDTTYGHTSLLRTTNGGSNWNPVTDLPAPRPRGICGISIVKNSQVAYACGRIEGPASLIKTTNGGVTWINIDMSVYASRFVDCYFTSADSGFVVGGLGTPYPATKAIILFTSDGGNSWVHRVNSHRLNEAFWKISFSSPLNGTASLNIADDSLFIYKTSDGGLIWERKGYPLSSGTYFTQGIGFVNPNTGWLGGDFGINYSYETIDGGNTWSQNDILRTINRIRFINDTLGYASGYGVYKYSTEKSIGIFNNTNELPIKFDLRQNFPNPFNPATVIQYDILVGCWVSLEVYNSTGQKIKTLYEGFESAGTYYNHWDGTNDYNELASSGLYFCRLKAGEYTVTKKMMLVK